jgi:hypothetical protein
MGELAPRVVIAGLLALAACRPPRVIEPMPGAHPLERAELTCVPSPPPTVALSIVTPRPDAVSVWIDGEWIWDGQSWFWKPGSWVLPPAFSLYAKPLLRRLGNGGLLWIGGHWHDADVTDSLASAPRERLEALVRCPPARAAD